MLRAGMAKKAAHVAEFVSSNFHKKISLKTMAGIANMSVFHFSRQFRKASGMSPMSYVRHVRVVSAIRAIRDGHQLVAVAHSCGFASHSHMHAAFALEGCKTPGSYRPVVTVCSQHAHFRVLSYEKISPSNQVSQILQSSGVLPAERAMARGVGKQAGAEGITNGCPPSRSGKT